MAFIIPNATDTTSGNKYAVLDQAEPDSLDFEVLGNDKSGVIKGCEVSETPSSAIPAVQVAEGAVAINGTVYAVAGDPYLRAPAVPVTGSRFDLVIARLINIGTIPQISLTFIQGDASQANPTYPRSLSRTNGIGGAAAESYFNPATDVVLAAIYRNANLPSIIGEHIVDKRKSVHTPISYRGATEPAATQGDVGDLYLRTSTPSNGESGLYVKRTTDQWAQLASVPIDPGVPIGTVITWIATTNPNTAVWVECNGAEVSRTGAYAGLFGVLGGLYGDGDGSTSFRLPDLRGMFLAGLPSAGASLGATYGNANNEVSLNSDQIPGHTHPINHSHPTVTTADSGTHNHGSGSDSHVHAMDHTHPSTTVVGGDHSHPANYLQNALNTGPNHYLRPMNYPTDGLIAAIPQSGGHSHTVNIPRFVGVTSTPSGGGTTSVDAGSHNHTVSIPSTVDAVSGANRNTAPNTVNIQPRTMYVRYFIRYA